MRIISEEKLKSIEDFCIPPTHIVTGFTIDTIYNILSHLPKVRVIKVDVCEGAECRIADKCFTSRPDLLENPTPPEECTYRKQPILIRLKEGK